MKYVMSQPAVLRFEWEIEVAIYALFKIGIAKEDIVILFSKHSDEVVKNIERLGVNVHVYDDNRFDKSYIPSIKPYLMYRYLEEDRLREKETYFFMDSDVIVKEEIKINNPLEGVWYGSDCGGYLNYDYIAQCEDGQQLIKDMAEIVGISIDDVKRINENSIGAQYIMSNPTSEYFEKVYEDSIKLWLYVKDRQTNYQKWCQEMVATLWNMPYFEKIPRVSKDMEFTWATDDIKKWNERKIFHNAGVTQDRTELFFKGTYTNSTPYEVDINNYSKDFASYNYVKLIHEAKQFLNK